MILKNDFYTVVDKRYNDNDIEFKIRLNAEHYIYSAHFPENPITPGVCIIQIAKDLTEDFLQKSLFLNLVKKVKFLQALDPLKHSDVSFVISTPENHKNEDYKINATLKNADGDVVFAKMNLFFTT